MAHIKRLVVFCLILISFLNFQCIREEEDPPISSYSPVYLSRSTFEKSISIKDPLPIVNSGKIYVKDNFLFINEVREGFHIIDNSDPKNPKRIKFIRVLGATDLAIRDEVIYINQATDLIATKFDQNNGIIVTKRIKGIFPELMSPDGFYADDIPENHVVVDWKLKNDN